MPLLSEFDGMKIYIYLDDTLPLHIPHIHVEYMTFIAMIDIENCVVIKGMLPANNAKLVLGWCELHKTELMSNWKKVQKHEMPLWIKPL